MAGSKSGSRNEILELALPQRLYSKQNQVGTVSSLVCTPWFRLATSSCKC